MPHFRFASQGRGGRQGSFLLDILSEQPPPKKIAKKNTVGKVTYFGKKKTSKQIKGGVLSIRGRTSSSNFSRSNTIKSSVSKQSGATSLTKSIGTSRENSISLSSPRASGRQMINQLSDRSNRDQNRGDPNSSDKKQGHLPLPQSP